MEDATPAAPELRSCGAAIDLAEVAAWADPSADAAAADFLARLRRSTFRQLETAALCSRSVLENA